MLGINKFDFLDTYFSEINRGTSRTKWDFERTQLSYKGFINNKSDFIEFKNISNMKRKMIRKTKGSSENIGYRHDYEKFYKIKIHEKYDIHHIDWNHDNNDMDNLIHLPRKIHVLIHNYFGYTTKEEIEKMRDDFENIERVERFTTQALKFRMFKYVNTRKSSKIAKLCKAKIQHKQIEYHYNFKR